MSLILTDVETLGYRVSTSCRLGVANSVTQHLIVGLHARPKGTRTRVRSTQPTITTTDY